MKGLNAEKIQAQALIIIDFADHQHDDFFTESDYHGNQELGIPVMYVTNATGEKLWNYLKGANYTKKDSNVSVEVAYERNRTDPVRVKFWMHPLEIEGYEILEKLRPFLKSIAISPRNEIMFPSHRFWQQSQV
jgi:hypothetical protein